MAAEANNIEAGNKNKTYILWIGMMRKLDNVRPSVHASVFVPLWELFVPQQMCGFGSSKQQ